jgi:hypothetical protein
MIVAGKELLSAVSTGWSNEIGIIHVLFSGVSEMKQGVDGI